MNSIDVYEKFKDVNLERIYYDGPNGFQTFPHRIKKHNVSQTNTS